MTRTAADQPATPREAAAAVLLSGVRDAEALLVQRGPTLRFMPGHYVFPGGTVDQDDARIAVRSAPSDTDRCHIAAAVRECFEEAGVLLAEGPLSHPEEPEWDGDMTDYLNSLERCATLNFSLLIPGHGMPYFGSAGAQALRDLVRHRLAREQRIGDAITQGASTMAEILAAAYADVDKLAWPLAKHQIRAHLPRLGIVLPLPGDTRL